MSVREFLPILRTPVSGVSVTTVMENTAVMLNCSFYGTLRGAIRWHGPQETLLSQINATQFDTQVGDSLAMSTLSWGQASVHMEGAYRCTSANSRGTVTAIQYLNVQLDTSHRDADSSSSSFLSSDLALALGVAAGGLILVLMLAFVYAVHHYREKLRELQDGNGVVADGHGMGGVGRSRSQGATVTRTLSTMTSSRQVMPLLTSSDKSTGIGGGVVVEDHCHTNRVACGTMEDRCLPNTSTFNRTLSLSSEPTRRISGLPLLEHQDVEMSLSAQTFTSHSDSNSRQELMNGADNGADSFPHQTVVKPVDMKHLKEKLDACVGNMKGKLTDAVVEPRADVQSASAAVKNAHGVPLTSTFSLGLDQYSVRGGGAAKSPTRGKRRSTNSACNAVTVSGGKVGAEASMSLATSSLSSSPPRRDFGLDMHI
ncbi:uncharacterized protein LOC135821534 [Sycon ciliatum]|uniref:uncharacterized protein LOC135821534 n=1 Tax=Sycon ciliatum TaxID=27933 RepID=UPI0031F672B5